MYLVTNLQTKQLPVVNFFGYDIFLMCKLGGPIFGWSNYMYNKIKIPSKCVHVIKLSLGTFVLHVYVLLYMYVLLLLLLRVYV